MTLLAKTDNFFPLQVIVSDEQTGDVWVETRGTCGGRIVACDNPQCWALNVEVEIADNGFVVHCGACGIEIYAD